MSKPSLKPSKYLDSCDFCESQEGTHYCLLHGCSVKNMNIVKCDDWTVQSRYVGKYHKSTDSDADKGG